jgi:hypothetical protein
MRLRIRKHREQGRRALAAVRQEQAAVAEQARREAEYDARRLGPYEHRGAYRPAATPRGGDRDAQGLGLVAGKTLAGGKGTPQPCHYCGEIGGHTSDCPVIS